MASAPQLTKRERQDLKEKREAEREGVSLVRQEKQADEQAQRKLAEAYHTERKTFSERVMRQGWRCTQCNHMNFESRLVCGRCVATAPHAKSTVNAARDIKKPGMSLIEECRIVTVNGRCYREFVSVNNAAKNKNNSSRTPLHNAAKDDDDDGEEEEFDWKRPVAKSCAPPMAEGEAYCNDDDDDEPPCHASSSQAAVPAASQRPLVSKGETGKSQSAAAMEDVIHEDDPTLDATYTVHFNTANNKYFTHVPVPSVVTTKSQQLRAVAKETQTEARWNKEPGSGGFVVAVSGASERSVRVAVKQVRAIFPLDETNIPPQPQQANCSSEVSPAQGKSKKDHSAGRVGFTHFISMPLGPIPTVDAPFRALLDLLRTVAGLPTTSSSGRKDEQHLRLEGVSGQFDSIPPAPEDHYGIDESVLQNPVRLHFTILMLSLASPEAVAKAQSLLPKVKEAMDRWFPAGASLLLKGLHTMTPAISSSNVMYLDVPEEDGSAAFSPLTAASAPHAKDFTSKPTGRAALSGLIRDVHKIFLEGGLTTSSDTIQGQKIHATVVNSKWRSSRVSTGAAKDPRKRWERQVTFDAAPFLKYLGNVSLGWHRPLTVEISRLSAAGGGEDAVHDAFYISDGTVAFASAD